MMITLLMMAVAQSAHAAPAPVTLKWRLSENAAHLSKVSFKLPYTAGTHEGESSTIVGSLVMSSDATPSSAEFSVPIRSLKTGSDKQDCHMRESLGLDYAVSEFPKSHVCSSNQLPETGVNSIKYPQIEFKLKSFADGKATGTWTIHGVPVERTFPVTISRDGGLLRITGSVVMPLEEHHITVKNFLFISVADDATASFDLWFESL